MELKIEAMEGKNIFKRMLSGEPVPMNDPDYYKIGEAVNRTRVLSVKLNNAETPADIRRYLGEITGEDIDETTMVFTPFHTNYGRHNTLGKNVYVPCLQFSGPGRDHDRRRGNDRPRGNYYF